MRIIRKHFPNVDGKMDEITRLLKSARGPDFIRRVRFTSSGEYMLRVHNEQGFVVAKSIPTIDEQSNILAYNEIHTALGGKYPMGRSVEDDFFEALDVVDLDDLDWGDEDETEDDFLSEFDEL